MMKRLLMIIIAGLFCTVCTIAQDSTTIDSSVTAVLSRDTGIVFLYTAAMEPKLVDPVVTVSGDMVSFQISYVDISCSSFSYTFERKGSMLLVCQKNRVCDKKTDQLYQVSGTLQRVPQGQFVFEFLTILGKEKQILLREAVTIK
jgi:hypothetical protein